MPSIPPILAEWLAVFGRGQADEVREQWQQFHAQRGAARIDRLLDRYAGRIDDARPQPVRAAR